MVQLSSGVVLTAPPLARSKPLASSRTGRVRPHALRWTHGLLNRVVICADGIAIVAGMLVASLVVTGSELTLSIPQSLLIAGVEILAFLWPLSRLKCYKVERYAAWGQLRDVLVGVVIAGSVGSVFIVAFRAPPPSAAATLLALHAPGLGFLLADRVMVAVLSRWIARHGILRRRTVILGVNAASEAFLARILESSASSEFEVLHVFADGAGERSVATLHGVPVHEIDCLAGFAAHNSIDLIVVALPLERARSLLRSFEELHWIPADVVIPVEQFGPRVSQPQITQIAGQPTLHLLHRPLRGSQAVVKLVEDYVVASLALLLVGPLMLLAALAIKLDSPGPVLFCQRRTGFNNQPFWILKFRTMTIDPQDDGSVGTTSRCDPRITRVGRVLRRFSIDELPQLFNVLRGEMSVVGPRPYVPNMLVEQVPFQDSIEHFAFRFRSKPGITGLAQASGMRSFALRARKNAQHSIDLDIHYVKYWSVWLDLEIMVRTLLGSMSGPQVF